MAKRTCCSDPSTAVSPSPISPESQTDRFNNDFLLDSFLHVSDFDSINTSFDTLIESRSSDSDKHDLIQRALHIGSILLEAGKRSDRKRSLFHNAVVWPLPPDLTIKVFALLDTQSVCYAAATCSFFQKCAADSSCFASIDLITSVPKVNNGVVSSLIRRAGNALQSIKLGVLPPSTSPLFCSSEPLVYSIRNSTDASGVSWNDKRSRQGKESSILTRSCLSYLSENGGAPGARLRRLHLFNVERMDNAALSASLSACPSLLDLEIVGLHVELRQTLESVSKHCPLIERLVFESSKTGRDDGLKHPTCYEFVHSCPNITTLALKGFKLHDYKARMLVKGLRKLKIVDFSTSYSFTGAFLKNLGVNGGGKHLEVMILRDCMHLKEIEVEHFMGAVLAGEFERLRHLDISNREGLASDGDWFRRCYSASFIPIKQLLEERPNFYLVAEFPKGSYIDVEQPTPGDLNSDVSLASQFSSHASDGSFLMSASDSGSDSGNEEGQETSFLTYDESSDEIDFLST
ncbi:putative leucine-rich repeat domain superfamily, F-box-like domain superfamily [Helianthus anomalus]